MPQALQELVKKLPYMPFFNPGILPTAIFAASWDMPLPRKTMYICSDQQALQTGNWRYRFVGGFGQSVNRSTGLAFSLVF